jgi:hypothetical protein
MLNVGDIMHILQDVRTTLDERISDKSESIRYASPAIVITGVLTCRCSYTSLLVPSSPELIDQALTSSGIPASSLPSTTPDELFNLLVDDTRRFVQTEDFALVLSTMLDRAFVVLEDFLTSSLSESEHGHGHGQEAEVQTKKTAHRFADVLPVMARWSHFAIYGLPNEIVEVSFSTSHRHDVTDRATFRVLLLSKSLLGFRR